MPINSSDITSYSNKTTEFSVYEQAFAIPYGVTAIATTRTKFGVSTKDIISGSCSIHSSFRSDPHNSSRVVSSRKNSIHSIPRRLLNPRRPKRKPTSEEAEEMLVQYDPVLPEDGRLVLSHYYEVRLGILYLPMDWLTTSTGGRRASDNHCAVAARIDIAGACGGHRPVPYARRDVRHVRCAL